MFPWPPSVEVTAVVTLCHPSGVLLALGAIPVTVTAKEHDPPPASEPFDKLIVKPEAGTEYVPPLQADPVVAVACKPRRGRSSVKPIPLSAMAGFGFVIVKVKLVVLPSAIPGGFGAPNAFPITGAKTGSGEISSIPSTGVNSARSVGQFPGLVTQSCALNDHTAIWLPPRSAMYRSPLVSGTSPSGPSPLPEAGLGSVPTGVGMRVLGTMRHRAPLFFDVAYKKPVLGSNVNPSSVLVESNPMLLFSVVPLIGSIWYMPEFPVRNPANKNRRPKLS